MKLNVCLECGSDRCFQQECIIIDPAWLEPLPRLPKSRRVFRARIVRRP